MLLTSITHNIMECFMAILTLATSITWMKKIISQSTILIKFKLAFISLM
uniref:Predicted protein n=1 Tax=Hordeum vulgare subsp. vulgare TaxID=112509 RepID=F2E5H2_HORVV|nr:predicted protein [Hordeum vulgare subsp. vulgare]